MRNGMLRSDNAPVLPMVKRAHTLPSRLRGLLGSPPLEAGEGLLIHPCNGIHTVGMKYILDIVFLARDGTILKLVPRLPPRRLAVCLRAGAVLELAAGEIARLSLELGQHLAFSPHPACRGHVSAWRSRPRAPAPPSAIADMKGDRLDAR